MRARWFYFWSGIRKSIVETDTDEFLVGRSSESVTATDTAILLKMCRPAERKTRVGTLIKGQLNVVHEHDEVSVQCRNS